MRKRGPQPRKDANHGEITKALEAIGCTVADTSGIGHGFPDALIGTCGRNILLEIKDGSLPPSKRRLTPDEQEWAANWKGTVYTVNTIQEAIEIVTFNRKLRK